MRIAAAVSTWICVCRRGGRIVTLEADRLCFRRHPPTRGVEFELEVLSMENIVVIVVIVLVVLFVLGYFGRGRLGR